MKDRNQSSSYLPRVDEAQADADFFLVNLSRSSQSQEGEEDHSCRSDVCGGVRSCGEP